MIRGRIVTCSKDWVAFGDAKGKLWFVEHQKYVNSILNFWDDSTLKRVYVPSGTKSFSVPIAPKGLGMFSKSPEGVSIETIWLETFYYGPHKVKAGYGPLTKTWVVSI